jgi:hypothetical protein
MKRLFFLIPAIILFAACKKDHRPFGATVLPEGDSRAGEHYEGLEVRGYTKGWAPVSSFNDHSRFLGSNLDPQFGKVDVGLYLNTNFDAAPTLSGNVAVNGEFIFIINGYHGNQNAVLSYSIFPLESTLSTQLVYKTDNYTLHSVAPIAAPGTVAVTGFTNSAHEEKLRVRIPVSQAYVATLMADPSLSSLEAFQAKYKGYYVVASASGTGCVYRLNLSDPDGGFYINYRRPNDATDYSFRFSFIGDRAVRFNTVKHDPANANPLLKSQVAGDTAAGSQNLFLHGLGVSHARIYIPSLRYSDTFNVAVNRAEVIFPVETQFSDDVVYPRPQTLALVPISAAGRDTFALDQTNSIDNLRYDGYYDDTRKAYVFNISRHAQAILKGEIPNRGFNLYVADVDRLTTARRDNHARRIVLYGSGRELKPTFNLSVVRLN